MFKNSVLAMALFFAASVAYAQADAPKLGTEDSVRLIISRFTTAIARSDARSYIRCFADTTVTVETLVNDRRGMPQIRRESLVANAYAISQVPPNTLFEQAEIGTVKIDGQIAHAWIPYKFYYGAQVQYCGTQSFHLIRLMGAWKIFYMLETRHVGSCK